jgi:hypothetical protein
LAVDSNFLEEIPAGISARSPPIPQLQPTGDFSYDSTCVFDVLSEKACGRSAFRHCFLELMDFLFITFTTSVLSRELLNPPIDLCYFGYGCVIGTITVGDGTLNAVTPIRCRFVALTP